MWNALSDDLKLTTSLMKLEKKYVAGMVTTARTIFAFNLDFLSFSVILYEYCIFYIVYYRRTTTAAFAKTVKIVFHKF